MNFSIVYVSGVSESTVLRSTMSCFLLTTVTQSLRNSGDRGAGLDLSGLSEGGPPKRSGPGPYPLFSATLVKRFRETCSGVPYLRRHDPFV